jgi:hypothetical protein
LSEDDVDAAGADAGVAAGALGVEDFESVLDFESVDGFESLLDEPLLLLLSPEDLGLALP